MGKADKQGNRKRTFSESLTSYPETMQVLTPGPVGSVRPPLINQPSPLINQNPFPNSSLSTPLAPPPAPPPPPVYPNYPLFPHYHFMEPTMSVHPLQAQFSFMGLNQSASSLQHLAESSLPVYLQRKESRHSDSETNSKVAHIGVFWDIENCGVPRGKSAMVVVQMIRGRFFQPNYVEAEFITVCDIRKESPQVIQELNDAQVTVIHVSGISKNAADDKLRQAMRRYADAYSLVGRSADYSQTHGTPAILLITGDVNFASDLSDLRHRKRIHVILLHNPHAPEALLACAHEHHNFHAGLEGVPVRGGAPACNGSGGDVSLTHDQFHDIMVIGLPPTGTKGKMNQLKSRLKRLSDNCGGKVAYLDNQHAVIRFKSRETALRAAKRMDGEDVLGVKIRTLSLNNFGLYSSLPPQAQGHGQPPLLLSPYPHLTHSQGQPHWQYSPGAPGPPLGPPPGTNTSEWNMWTSPYLVQNSQQRKVVLTPKKKQIQPPPPAAVAIKEEPKDDENGGQQSSNSDSASPKSEDNGGETSEEATTDSNGSEEEVLTVTTRKDVTPPPPAPLVVKGSKSSMDGSSVSYSSSSDDDSSNLPTVTENPTLVTTEIPPAVITDQSPRVKLIYVVTAFDSFASRVTEILHLEGTLELGQFLANYASRHGSFTEVDEGEGGVPVEHLLNAVKGVRVTWTPEGEREVSQVENQCGQQSGHKASAQLRVEITNLLKTFPRCTIPITELSEAYLSRYGKELLVANDVEVTDAVDQRRMKEVKDTLRSTVHLIGTEPDVYATLTHDVQMKLFAVDMLRILKSREVKEISLEGFSEAFSTVTGRVFQAADYGLCSLRDLIKELIRRTSHITLVHHGEETSVKLV